MTIDAASTNRRTVPSIAISSARGTWSASSAAPTRNAPSAKSRPATPPARPSTSDSTRSCWQHAAAAGAERGADRDFLAAAERAREQQVADVGTGDQQDEADRRQQHDQRPADVADDVLLQRNDRRAPAGVRLRDTPAPDAARSPRAASAPRPRRCPGFRRATTCTLWFSRTARASFVSASGTQRSREVAPHEASDTDGGITPTIV